MRYSKELSKYGKNESVQQLLLVEHSGGSDALARYYTKGAKGWRLRGKGSAFVGKNGVGKTREGDAKTPVGELRPLRAFGILPDPGCALPYLHVVPGTFACDEQGPNYNRIVQTGSAEPSPGYGGERMWELSPEYDYGIETDYNSRGIWPMGSAIFIHCKGAKAWTGGCVALEKELMKKVLLTATEKLVILIRRFS
ncbi:MAG: hypothetical protein IJU68_04375 [Bacteroidales bacterium]|nr:hypothetical protein [Bacteroidales bacterium]